MDFSVSAAVGLLLLALPAGLVFAAHRILRSQPIMWAVVAVTWAAAVWFWVDYNLQTDDVGIMVSGLVAFAVSVSAMAATLAAVIIEWRR